ncbi:hypothetical protein ACFPIJ_08235 [Dactylosporangium cerinum]|uniref:XRE family transcriptional regulator n=1 Tax=Dactylosporangium cerinum TaxID=1434730 RepID=A0ABV9VNZ6_9ACTN
MDATPLERLCAHHGVPAPAVSPAALVGLAPVLDLHPADLLAVGGGEIPGAYLPATTADATTELARIRSATWDAGEETLAALRAFVRSVPAAPDRTGTPPWPALDPVTVGGVVGRLMHVRNLSRRWVAEDSWLAATTVSRLTNDGIDGRPAADIIETRFILRVADALNLRHGDFLAIVGRVDEITPALREEDRTRPPNQRGRLMQDLAPLPPDQLRQVAEHAEATGAG